MRITRTGGGRGRRAAAVTTTVLTASALLLTGCSSDDSDSSDSNGNITLKLADFGQFGYKEAKLFDEYHKLHPNITVKEETSTKEEDYYPKLLQQLNAGSGLGDVTGIEVGRTKEVVTTQADKFVDLSKTINVADWVDWKEKQVTTDDGKVIGAGTDIGPMSLCYRRDLFEKAGLPTDREDVTKAVAGGWEDYIKLGEKFKKKAPDKTYFMDSASAMYNAVVSSSRSSTTAPTASRSTRTALPSRRAGTWPSRPRTRASRRVSPSSTTRGPPRSARAPSRPWPARRGWPARSPSTPVTTSRASGTSPVRPATPPPTGAVPSSRCRRPAST